MELKHTYRVAVAILQLSAIAFILSALTGLFVLRGNPSDKRGEQGQYYLTWRSRHMSEPAYKEVSRQVWLCSKACDNVGRAAGPLAGLLASVVIILKAVLRRQPSRYGNSARPMERTLPRWFRKLLIFAGVNLGVIVLSLPILAIFHRESYALVPLLTFMGTVFGFAIYWGRRSGHCPECRSKIWERRKYQNRNKTEYQTFYECDRCQVAWRID